MKYAVVAIFIFFLIFYIVFTQHVVQEVVHDDRMRKHAESPFVNELNSNEEAILAFSGHLEKNPSMILVYSDTCPFSNKVMGAFVQAAATSTGVDWYRIEISKFPFALNDPRIKSTPSLFGRQRGGVEEPIQYSGTFDVTSLRDFALKIKKNAA
jgi:hypothetical protein